MKVILLTSLVCLMVSCEDVGDRYVKKFEMVEISKTNIPDTVYVMDEMQIKVKAQGDNGCWSNLYLELKQTEPFNYTLKAYGTFESFGICHDILVIKDTVIDYQPTEKGTYLFHISKYPNEVDIDTMIVI